MKIYIPKHIRNIEVVDTMCKLIEAYANDPSLSLDPGSFNNYYYYLNTDPVNRFLHICILESDVSEDYESVISYISRLFYSVKGTTKVFEFMKKYLGLNLNDIVYTVKELNFTISEVRLSDIDEKVFYESLMDFLRALLYFGEARIRIEVIHLLLSNTLKNYTGASIETYKKYTTVRYEN